MVPEDGCIFVCGHLCFWNDVSKPLLFFNGRQNQMPLEKTFRSRFTEHFTYVRPFNAMKNWNTYSADWVLALTGNSIFFAYCLSKLLPMVFIFFPSLSTFLLKGLNCLFPEMMRINCFLQMWIVDSTTFNGFQVITFFHFLPLILLHSFRWLDCIQWVWQFLLLLLRLLRPLCFACWLDWIKTAFCRRPPLSQHLTSKMRFTNNRLPITHRTQNYTELKIAKTSKMHRAQTALHAYVL